MRCARAVVAAGCLLACGATAAAQTNATTNMRSGPAFSDDQGRFEVHVPTLQPHTITVAPSRILRSTEL